MRVTQSGLVFSCGCPKRGRLGRKHGEGTGGIRQEFDGRTDAAERKYGEDKDDDPEAPVHFAVPGEVRLGDGDGELATSIAAGDHHSVAITLDGNSYIWGANESGVLGREALPPPQFDALGKIILNFDWQGNLLNRPPPQYDADGTLILHSDPRNKPNAIPPETATIEPDFQDAPEPFLLKGFPPIVQVACMTHSSAFLTEDGSLLLMGGDPAVPTRPRLAGLPGTITAIFGGGFHLGVLLGGTTSPAQAAANLALGKSIEAAAEANVFTRNQRAAGMLPAPEILLSPEFRDKVPPEVIELLLADCVGAPPLQLRHELRMLRDLLSAEKAKLGLLEVGAELDSPATREAFEHEVNRRLPGELVHPSSDTWTDKQKIRDRDDDEEDGGPKYVATVNAGTGPGGGGGMLHVAKTSAIQLEDRRAAMDEINQMQARPKPILKYE